MGLLSLGSHRELDTTETDSAAAAAARLIIAPYLSQEDAPSSGLEYEYEVDQNLAIGDTWHIRDILCN